MSVGVWYWGLGGWGGIGPAAATSDPEVKCRPPSRTTDASRQILWRTTTSEWCQSPHCLFSSSPSRLWWVLLLLLTHLSLSLSACLSLLLVELWTLAVRLRERRPWPWVLHHWPVSANVHRPVAGEYRVFVLELRDNGRVHLFKHQLLSTIIPALSLLLQLISSLIKVCFVNLSQGYQIWWSLLKSVNFFPR